MVLGNTGTTVLLVDSVPSGYNSTMNSSPLPTQTALVAVPASGPGALSGFQVTCSCGLVIKSSMESSARLDAQDHARWHQKRGR